MWGVIGTNLWCVIVTFSVEISHFSNFIFKSFGPYKHPSGLIATPVYICWFWSPKFGPYQYRSLSESFSCLIDTPLYISYFCKFRRVCQWRPLWFRDWASEVENRCRRRSRAVPSRRWCFPDPTESANSEFAAPGRSTHAQLQFGWKYNCP